MREKKGFSLRQVCGEYIMVAVGKENIDFSNVVSMNETSVFLWNTFQDKDFTEEDMAKALFDEYDVSMENARKDVADLVKQWALAGIIEGEDVPEFAPAAGPEAPQSSEAAEKPKKEGFFKRLLHK